MWVLGLLLLVGMMFVVGALASLIWFLVSPTEKRPTARALLAIPLGFAAFPVAAALVLGLITALFTKSDRDLYKEIFGTGTTVPEQSMLFDEFGHGRTREIYMRISPDYGERDALMSLPGLKPSDSTLEEFIARGDQHGFMWWLSSDPNSFDYCMSARIFEADGFRGWRQLRIAECVDEDGRARQSLYVIAWQR